MARVGDRVGPFELVERVRRGRHTSLFRALRRDSSNRAPREVAVRFADPGADAALLDGLRAEYDTLRLLQDERIPQAAALYTGHGAVALEWVHGATLADALRLVAAGRIDLDAATSLDILVELAYALRHAHAMVRDEGRIVHGTLSPEVVGITPAGAVVLHGFADPDPSHGWPLAPEQQHGVQDPRTDQWLLGALGVELLRHAPEVLAEARDAPVEVAFALLQARWPAATRVLARALAEDPANRYEGDERLIKDLLALKRTVGGGSRRAELGARSAQLAASLDAPEPGRLATPGEARAVVPVEARVAAALGPRAAHLEARAAAASVPGAPVVPVAPTGSFFAPAAIEPPPEHVPTLIERPAAPPPGPPLTVDADEFLPSTWPRHDAIAPVAPAALAAAAEATAEVARPPLGRPPPSPSRRSLPPGPTPVTRTPAPVEVEAAPAPAATVAAASTSAARAPTEAWARPEGVAPKLATPAPAAPDAWARPEGVAPKVATVSPPDGAAWARPAVPERPDPRPDTDGAADARPWTSRAVRSVSPLRPVAFDDDRTEMLVALVDEEPPPVEEPPAPAPEVRAGVETLVFVPEPVVEIRRAAVEANPDAAPDDAGDAIETEGSADDVDLEEDPLFADGPAAPPAVELPPEPRPSPAAASAIARRPEPLVLPPHVGDAEATLLEGASPLGRAVANADRESTEVYDPDWEATGEFRAGREPRGAHGSSGRALDEATFLDEAEDSLAGPSLREHLDALPAVDPEEPSAARARPVSEVLADVFDRDEEGRPHPVVRDPVPDQWVVGAVAVFGVVAVLAAAWTVAG